MVDIFYPLQWIADKVTYAILRIGPDTHLGASVDFIIYEVMKILILLVAMIFVVSYIRTYITPEKTRKALEGKKGLQYHLLASLLGAITPFCSCSAVPIFIGFLEAGVPLGVTFSFLIASPPGKRSRSCCFVGHNWPKSNFNLCSFRHFSWRV